MRCTAPCGYRTSQEPKDVTLHEARGPTHPGSTLQPRMNDYFVVSPFYSCGAFSFSSTGRACLPPLFPHRVDDFDIGGFCGDGFQKDLLRILSGQNSLCQPAENWLNFGLGRARPRACSQVLSRGAITGKAQARVNTCAGQATATHLPVSSVLQSTLFGFLELLPFQLYTTLSLRSVSHHHLSLYGTGPSEGHKGSTSE